MMPAAKALVDEKKYSEAIKILAEVVKNQPERLDEVETLMAVIRTARNQYNNNYSSLIELLKKESLTDADIENAYSIINEMEKIDAAPDTAIRGSFDKARRTIVFRYNDMQFRDIMDRALALLDEKKYWEALALYSEAAGLHRDIFAEDYPEDVLAETDAMVMSVKKMVADILADRERYTASYLRAAAESGRQEPLPVRMSEYDDFRNSVEKIAVIRENAVIAAEDFENRKNELMKEGEYDVPFLSTVNRVITGRKTGAREEGILAAIDLLWFDSVSASTALLAARSEAAFNSGRGEFAQKLYAGSETSFSLAENYSGTENALTSLLGFSISPHLLSGLNLGGREYEKFIKYMPEYLDSSKRTRAAGDYVMLSQVMQRISEIERNYPAEKNFTAMLSYRNRVVTDNSMISLSRAAWAESVTQLEGVADSGINAVKPLGLSVEMRDLFSEYGRNLDELAVSVVRAAIDVVYRPLSDNLAAQKEAASKGYSLVDGAQKTFGTGDTAYNALVKYPQQAMEIFTGVLAELASTETGLRQLLDLIKETGGSAASHPLLVDSNDSAGKDIGEIVSLRNSVNRYMQTAGELVTQAEIFRNQGNRYIGEARVNLERLNFTVAREKLQQARESYLNSLSNNEDQQLRDSSDREILAISDEIIRLQSRVVVDTVRKNLVQARDYYVRERFGDAENLLINSQTLWKTVNTENNPEVEYWLSLVQTALSVRSGRTIAVTDPLYNEMTQVLNLARNDYLNAVAADLKGNREEMLKFLAAAEEKLLYISIPFPLNQEASVLSLRILKLKDKQNFDTLFRERFETARQKIDINPSETYTVLKDLQVINPGYPGIDQAIYRTEIKLGIRTPPPDPAKIREAETLYQRAYTIVLSNVRSNYPTALAYLNRAFELNPDDGKITTLKDRVQTEMGGTTTVVLSSYAQQQYRLAEQEFINGNYYASLAIVEKLLQDSRNRNYTPLLELKRRIDSKI